MDTTWKKKLLVAAINFGTTFSGIAFSFLSDYEQDKTEKFICYMWEPRDQTRTHKTPTCLLLKPDLSFHSFGYEAEEKYTDLVEDNRQKEWHYFRRFEMKLYNNSDKNACGFSAEGTIKDTEGRDFNALTVFSHSIYYMKKKIIEIFREKFPVAREDDIHYVLTTPAIRSEQDKLFMRRAAINASISSERLRIALEPECVAVYVHTKELPALDMMTQEKRAMKPGSCHVIIDLGGDTLDIAVHQVNDHCQFEEIIPPYRGHWGVDNINMKYEQFLIRIVGGPAFSKFRDNHTDDYLTMQRTFENKKYAFKDTGDDSKVTIQIPKSFRKLHEKHNEEKLTESVRQMPISDDVEFKGDKIRINTKLFRSFFTDTIDGILETVQGVMSKVPMEIDTVICVGEIFGYQLLKRALHAKFSDKIVIILPDAATSIMKGAIIFDRDQSIFRTMDTTWKKKLFVAAIDFGTTFSGFALSSRSDYEKDKTINIVGSMWEPGDQPRTHKTPTCLLLKPDLSFHSFGYDAEEKYAELAEDNKHKDWHYFRRFKMKLYKPSDRNTCGLSTESTIKDTEGRDFNALAVFSHSIYYMKKKIIETIGEKFPGVREDDIHYVLTTPAIWSEQAKLFMRRAAKNAHIPPERLRIALEPECAAVYVHTKELPALDMMTQEKRAMKPGSCHVIIDLGGGTLDIAAHQVNDHCQFEEIIPPDGGPLGGDNINMKYEQFLIRLSGGPAFSKFRDNHMDDYLTMQRQFENKKYAFKDTGDDSKVNIQIPESFRKLHEKHNEEKLTESVRQMPISDDVDFKGDKIRIKTKLFRSFFTDTIDGILETVEGVLSKVPMKIDIIICVGGFSGCQLLKDALRARFLDKTVIIPPEAVTSIMKGAIIFGRDQSVVNKRISRYTYGLDWNEDFDPAKHDPAKKEETDDGHVCRDIFRKLIGKNEQMPCDRPTQEIDAYVKSKYQTVLDFPFYRSEIHPNPKYIDEMGCHLMGTMRVNLGEPKVKSLDRCVKLKVNFGATELRAEAEDDTGKKYEVVISLEETS